MLMKNIKTSSLRKRCLIHMNKGSGIMVYLYVIQEQELLNNIVYMLVRITDGTMGFSMILLM